MSLEVVHESNGGNAPLINISFRSEGEEGLSIALILAIDRMKRTIVCNSFHLQFVCIVNFKENGVFRPI